MKILHAANFSLNKHARAFYATDRKLSNGFARLGHLVYDFSYRDVARAHGFWGGQRGGRGKMNRALLKTVEALRPDLLLLGLAESISPQSLREAKRLFPSLKIAQWWVDAFHEHAREALRARFPFLDVFFCTTSPFFISRWVGELPCRAAYIPNVCDESIETGKAFGCTQWACDFLFAGKIYPARRPFLEEIQKALPRALPQFKVEIKDGEHTPLLQGAAYTDLLAHTRSGLNYSCDNTIPLYTSDRLIQLTGNGVATFSPRVPELETLFGEDELIYFDGSPEDLVKQAQRILKDEEHCRDIARRGWERAHRVFNEKRIATFILDVVFEEERQKSYEWSRYIL